MKFILLVICVFALTNAIRVPSKWQNGLQHHKHFVTPIRNNRYFNHHNKFSVPPHNIKLNKKKFRRKFPNPHPPVGFQNLYRRPQNQFAELSNRMNIWTPVAPFSINTNLGHMVHKPNFSIDLTQFPKDHFIQSASEFVRSTSSPIYRNYRDDKTSELENDRNEYSTDSPPEIHGISEDIVKSDHEKPLDIPTRPIYPGEKIWAKPGKIHKPFVRENIFAADRKKNQEERPEGYEILEEGENLLNKKRSKFENIPTKQSTNKNPEEIRTGSREKAEEEVESEENDDEFVPMTLYTQVRRSGHEDHLPSDSEDSEGGRLKEVIKDSKIHTVYTEEGYEDSAYDHAGQEKEAEGSQGYSEYNKEEEHKKDPKQNNTDQHFNTDQVNEESSKIFRTAEFPGKGPSDHEKSKSNKPLKNKNKFTKTKKTKTTELKEHSDGTRMQITSEVKMMFNPQNGSATEIIEIMPKVVKYFDVDSPKIGVNDLLKESSSNEKLELLHRKKRFTNDLSKIDVKQDFIKGVEQSDIPDYRDDVKLNKYPYYNARYLNKNSPLRYSENLEHIPHKIEGKMVFYEQANRIQCPEVSDDIEAIPQRIQEVEEAINNGEKLEDSRESGKSPRLGKLGQRIDCLKRKYFGENPLDSPFFKEETVGQVLPLFKIFEKKKAGFQNHYNKPDQSPTTSDNKNDQSKRKYHSKFSIEKIQDQINENLELNTNNENLIVGVVNENSMPDSKQAISKADTSIAQEAIVDKLNPHQEISPYFEIIDVDDFRSIDQITTATPSMSQIASPNYSLDNLSKHIYDQNELLPSQTAELTVTAPEIGNERKAKLIEESLNQTFQAAELRMNYRPNHYRPSSKVRRKIWYRRPQQNFDINTYLANQNGKTGNNIHNPHYMNSKSHYSEQIVPLEQLNVFSDVLNNIKNGTNDPTKAGIFSYSVPNQITNFYTQVAKIKIPSKKIHVKTSDLTKYLNNRNGIHIKSTTSTTTEGPTQKPRRGVIKYKTTTEREYYDDDYIDVNNDQIFGKKTINSGKKSTNSLLEESAEHNDTEISESHTTHTITTETAERIPEILGLVPPSKWQYRTIYQPVEKLILDSSVSSSEMLNTYYVLGMKPPSTKHKVYDFQKLTTGKGTSRFQNVKFRRGKRSANRKSYFEVVGNRKQDITETSTEGTDDDYVPHRPKNWHWDEKLKKIVYDKPKDEEYESDDNEEEEIEIEDPITKNIQQTSTRRIFTTTTPINGPSYVDLIKILKTNKNYVNIPDPTTAKAGMNIETTTMSTTTFKSGPTKQPEFLNILMKLRQSDSYVQIKDKNNTKTTTTIETPAEEDEEYISDSETALSNMQNSPGKGAVDIGHNLKIFDVNDFLPRVKTYSPRTSIDYSKYKTIRRTPSRRSTTESPEEYTLETVQIIATTPLNQNGITSTTERKLEIIELSRDKSPTYEETTSTAPTTTIKIQRTRGRRPLTTSTASSTASATVSKRKVVFVTASKPKRVYPRRSPSHIKTRSTTEKQTEAFDPTKYARNVRRRHNDDESNGGETKIISLETLIKMDQLDHTGNNSSSQKLDKSSSDSGVFEGLNSSLNISVDDILKNINHLKEVNIEETVPDYSDDSSSSLVEDESAIQANENDKEYFDDDTKIELSGEKTTDRRLVISKNKEEGMYHYDSVR